MTHSLGLVINLQFRENHQELRLERDQNIKTFFQNRNNFICHLRLFSPLKGDGEQFRDCKQRSDRADLHIQMVTWAVGGRIDERGW